MAVEKSKVIARLKALFPKANLSQKRLDALADKLASKPADEADDLAIDEVINDFNSILSIEEIAREDDRVRTLEKKANDTPQPTPSPTPVVEDKKEDEVLALVKSLASEIASLKSGREVESKKSMANELFSKSEILKKMPESVKASWMSRIDLDSEVTYDNQILNFEKEYTDLVQGAANSNNYAGAAGQGVPANTIDENMLKDVIGSM